MNIYIDCTDIILSQQNTGIQRVVRNLTTFCTKHEDYLGIRCQLVFFDKYYGFIRIKNSNKNSLQESVGYFHTIRISLREPWRIKRLIKYLFPITWFHDLLDRFWQDPARLLLSVPLLLFSLPIILFSIIYTFFKQVPNKWHPKINDIFLIPGSSWWNFDMRNAINLIKKQKGHVAVVIFDLIPISHSQTCGNYAQSFAHELPFLIKNADLFLAISRTTQNALVDYIATQKILNPAKIVHFLLGADLDQVKPEKPRRKELLSFFKKRPYVCVGTLEPRKNHNFLLDAFDHLWQKDPDVALCIIGRYGWKSEELVKRLRHHPQYTHSLIWFDNLNDTELAYCYQNSKALIFPSIIEGFGLPLVEALHYGRPVFASDIPIFKEIGGERCIYFSLGDPCCLANIIEQNEKKGNDISMTHAAEFKWISWNESSKQFYSLIVDHFGTYENSLTQ